MRRTAVSKQRPGAAQLEHSRETGTFFSGGHFFRFKTNKQTKVGDNFKASDDVILVDVVTPRGPYLVQPICLTAVRLQETPCFVFFCFLMRV